MKKILVFFTGKSLIKNIVFSLSAACISITLLCYVLYYFNTFRILENQLTEQTRSQLAVNNRNMEKNFDTLDTVWASLINQLTQYDTASPYSYASRLNDLTDLANVEAIDFANYTISALQFYLSNHSILDSISIYTRGGTVISTNGTLTKAQILQSERSDFIIDNVIPHFDKNLSSALWLGTHKTDEFILGFSRSSEGSNASSHVFSIIRRVRNIYEEQKDFFIVLNMKLDAIQDAYYTYPITDGMGSVFLLDAAGTIHYSNRENLIGTRSVYAPKLTEKKSFTAFSSSADRQQQNVFYQSLYDGNWFVLYEIPASTYTADISSFRNISVIFFLITITIMLLIVFLLIIRKLKPINELTRAVTRIGQGNLGYTIHIQEENEIGILARNFNHMSQNLKTLMEKKEQIEAQKRRQEIAALQAQINPHFILNTINTVKWMAILNNAANISECLTSFGRLLEPLLKQQTDFYTIKEEISYLENYIDVMNYSYGNTIHMTLSIPEEINACRVPRFILQPLVENAVLHGVNKDTNEVQIDIQISEQQGILCVCVFSCGTSIPEDKLLKIQHSLVTETPILGTKKSSIGLTNVLQRIKTFYGEPYSIWIENSSDCEVKVSVTIPKTQ